MFLSSLKIKYQYNTIHSKLYIKVVNNPQQCFLSIFSQINNLSEKQIDVTNKNIHFFYQQFTSSQTRLLSYI